MKKSIIAVIIMVILNTAFSQSIDKQLSYKSIKVFGQNLKYVEQGKGQTLILLHGLGSNSERWIYNIDELAKSYHIIALDQIGFGYSDKPTIPYKGLTLVEFLHEFMLQKKIDKVSLIGNSMGGWIATLFAVTHPNKLDKLVLVDPAFLFGLSEDAKIDKMYDFANPTTIEAMKIYTTKIYYQNENLLKTKVLKENLTKKLSWNDGYTVYQILKSLKSNQDLLNSRLKEIQAKTIIIHGKNDEVVPFETIEKLKKGIKNSSLILYDNSGHSPMYEESVKFNNDVIRFLKEK